jgi:hypothetical protein
MEKKFQSHLFGFHTPKKINDNYSKNKLLYQSNNERVEIKKIIRVKIDKNILNKKEKDYFPKLAETERAIQKIHLNKINIESERNLDNTLQKVNDDQMNLLKGLENSKELLLSDISINDRNFSK